MFMMMTRKILVCGNKFYGIECHGINRWPE